ncbi:hypothetical protein [Actinomadura sp. 7K534]|uniref:hypothetical protein n=1 Tax=Actinomadura sp. 7K534 TaxID=2530366 RepID=UPI0010466D05|nr:hypothetical protein [Actinomadura sp. 7K534]TDB97755.1 hypothetical protein E1266_05550 [Actinomadura sp. 7K534]
MRLRSALAAIAGAALLALPVTAHAAGKDVHTVPLPFLWPRTELKDVASDGAGGAWIAGRQGVVCVVWVDRCALFSAGNPVVRRWTGSSWREYPINGWKGNGPIEQVTSGAGRTWIAGEAADNGYIPFLAEFDGSSFQRVETPSSASVEMLSTGPAGTWIAQADDPNQGAPRLYRRDGAAWQAFDLPGGDAYISDVQGIAPDDAWAVGARQAEDPFTYHPAVARFDGTSWTWTTPPDIGAQYPGITKVVPLGPDDVWASGRGRFAHWDGTSWTVIDGPLSGNPDRQLLGFAVDGAGTVWAAMHPSTAAGNLYRRTGGTWESVAVPAGVTLGGVAVTGASTMWGVGRANDAPVAVSDF